MIGAKLIRFIRSESSSGLLLLCMISLSLILANSAWAAAFSAVLARPVGVGLQGLHLEFTVLDWINDGLMSTFFLLVGLEVKRSLVAGALSDLKATAVPVLAAIGGCVVPAGIFLICTAGTAYATGWAIPMATDIAFSLAVLNIAARGRAGSATIFLSTLAIADDLIAILVIALFYNANPDPGYIAAAAVLFAIQLVLARLRVAPLLPYVLLGAALWYCLHRSGVHATLAGVLTAFAIPLRARGRYPLERLERMLLKPVNYLVVPLFVFSNTNIRLSGEVFSPAVMPLAAGIVLGLALGKPVGILLTTYLVTRLRIGVLMPGLSWKALTGAGILAGIGFTISIFIATLSFPDSSVLGGAKTFVLITALISGIAGYVAIRSAVAST